MIWYSLMTSKNLLWMNSACTWFHFYIFRLYARLAQLPYIIYGDCHTLLYPVSFIIRTVITKLDKRHFPQYLKKVHKKFYLKYIIHLHNKYIHFFQVIQNNYYLKYAKQLLFKICKYHNSNYTGQLLFKL